LFFNYIFLKTLGNKPLSPLYDEFAGSHKALIS
jgi:hypothetical protein